MSQAPRCRCCGQPFRPRPLETPYAQTRVQRPEQHDTSPHRLAVGGRPATAQCAGPSLGFSRYAFIQYYPRFTRFQALAFLDAAFAFPDGTCARCDPRQYQRLGGRRQRTGGDWPDGQSSPRLG
jgi:hypothetical protein